MIDPDDPTPPHLRYSERKLWTSYGEDGPPDGHTIRTLLLTISSQRVARDIAHREEERFHRTARVWFVRMFVVYAMSATVIGVGCYLLGGRA